MYAEGRIQWTTGDRSGGLHGLGGTEALVGIDAGDCINHVTVPGSRTSDIINITRTSNVGIPGVWMFQVGRGMYLCTMVTLHSVCMYMCVHAVWLCNIVS